jgi:putative phosphoesterase
LSTRIGIISDIHGDFVALEEALAVLDHQAVNAIICAGDLVHMFQAMPYATAVIELLQERQIPCVMGNHDSQVLIDFFKLRESDPVTVDAAATLTPESAAFLKSLPLSQQFDFEGKTVLMRHGMKWWLYPHTSSTAFWQIQRLAETDAVVLGHTHEPMNVRVGRTQIVNPGSVCGTLYRGSRSCGVLALPENDFVVYSLDGGRALEIPLRTIE